MLIHYIIKKKTILSKFVLNKKSFKDIDLTQYYTQIFLINFYIRVY